MQKNQKSFVNASNQAQGSPITGYTIAALINGTTTYYNVSLNSISSVLLENLTAGATAIVSYAGCNIVGCGEYSATDNIYLAGIPALVQLTDSLCFR